MPLPDWWRGEELMVKFTPELPLFWAKFKTLTGIFSQNSAPTCKFCANSVIFFVLQNLVAGAGKWVGWMIGDGQAADADLPAFETPEVMAVFKGTTWSPDGGAVLYLALDGEARRPRRWIHFFEPLSAL
jgi:hypothetical protein